MMKKKITIIEIDGGYFYELQQEDEGRWLLNDQKYGLVVTVADELEEGIYYVEDGRQENSYTLVDSLDELIELLLG